METKKKKKSMIKATITNPNDIYSTELIYI